MMEKTEKIAILEKLVSIDTTDQAEGVIADYLADLFAQHGIHTEKVASKPGREKLSGLSRRSNRQSPRCHWSYGRRQHR